MAKPLIHKTITHVISAHHRLISNRLNHEENVEVFSKCMGLYGHGHNYKLKATYRWSYDQEDPFFIQSIDESLQELVVRPFLYKSLNVEFERMGIENPVTTGEQIIEVLGHILEKSPISDYLDQIELVETRKNSFFYQFNNFRI